LAVALGVNLALVVGQVVGGVAAHSSGLLADAGHNFADAASLVLALLAVRWALRPRSDSRSFGNHRGTVLAALVNAAALAAVTVAVVAESVVRLVHPAPVDGAVVVAVAGAAIVANGLAALVLAEHTTDLNMRAALTHAAADVASSFVVLVAGLVIAVTGHWDRLDPVASLVVAVLIVVEAVRLVRASADVLLESTPSDVDLAALRSAITAVPGVGEVHDLHVWSLSSEVRALSAHLVLTGHPTLEEAQEVARVVRARVEEPFDLAHTTFELECERCADDEIDPCAMDGRPVTAGGSAAADLAAPVDQERPVAAVPGVVEGAQPAAGPPRR
jgi:cobalt-zinc-cadmium efflux system protein